MNRAYQRALEKYLPQENVTGVAVGLKFRNGQWTDEMVISIRVREKKPKDQLQKGELIPKTILGVKTDVIQASYKPLSTSRFDTIKAGMSIGREASAEYGTLGLIVYKDDEPYILTNFHVVVAPGLTITTDWIIQPAAIDGGGVPDRVGLVEEYSITTAGDFAIVKINTNLKGYLQQIYGTDDIVTTTKRPTVNDVLTKSGRTTDVTYGKVSALGTFSVDYSAWGLGTINIVGFEYIPLTDPNELIVGTGDSGACCYTEVDNAAVGLVTAASYSPTVVCACFIDTAFSLFDLTLTPKGASALSNTITVPWINAGDEFSQSISLTFEKAYTGVFLYTDSEHADALTAKLSNETAYKPIGAFCQNPSCILGNIPQNTTVSVDLKVASDAVIGGFHNIPIYVSYGAGTENGLNVGDIFWRNPDSVVTSWASNEDEAEWLQWRK